MNRLAIALQHGKGYPQEHDGAVRLHPRGPNAQLPSLIGELCFMQCVDFTGATCIVLAVLLEVPNLLCVAIVSSLRSPAMRQVRQCSLG